MRLIDADKLFEQVEELYKSAKPPERYRHGWYVEAVWGQQAEKGVMTMTPQEAIDTLKITIAREE